MTKSFDLVGDLSLVFVLRVKGKVSGLCTEIVKLNWAWVTIMVSVSPTSFNSLHSLIRFSIKINFFTRNDEISSLIPTLRLGSHHGKQRDTSNSPL